MVHDGGTPIANNCENELGAGMRATGLLILQGMDPVRVTVELDPEGGRLLIGDGQTAMLARCTADEAKRLLRHTERGGVINRPSQNVDPHRATA